ncbi:MAG: hypothetical protein WCI45_14770, partial [Desulfuromonadales bacterium]
WRKAYVASNFSIDELREELWAKKGENVKKSGIEVRLIVSPDVEFARYSLEDDLWIPTINRFDLLQAALEEETATSVESKTD